MKRVVSDKEFNEARANEDNRKICSLVSSKYSSSLGWDVLKSCADYGLWTALAYYNPNKGKKFTTFLWECVNWECIREIKSQTNALNDSQKKVINISSNETPSMVLIDERNSPEITDVIVTVNDCLDTMPKQDAELLRKYYIDNMTLNEISMACGKSIETVRKRINKSSEKFATLYRKNG